MRIRRFVTFLLTFVIASLPIIGLWQRMAIFDWYRLRNYQASAAVSQLATDTTMLDNTRRIFYVYHPAIEDKTAFNAACRDNEQTIVLGCYVDRDGIHLLDIKDSRLSGVEEVTAAHETLHAVYARLNATERKKVDAMTAKALATVTDQRVLDTVELYRKQEPNSVPNELHSILGTEVKLLPADLENYYKQYFFNRAKIVGYSDQYEKAFTDRKEQIASYNAQLASLKTQIEALEANLSQSAVALSKERATLDDERASGDITAYNAGVAPFNSHIKAYNVKIDQLSALVSQYNDIVPKVNELATEEQDLAKALDSRTSVPARQ